MKKIESALFLLMFIIASSAIILIGTENEAIQKEAGSELITTGYKYTVKGYDGKVAVFDYGCDDPVEVLDCPLNSLPESEAEKLKTGINISNETELQQLIEAFD